VVAAQDQGRVEVRPGGTGRGKGAMVAVWMDTWMDRQNR